MSRERTVQTAPTRRRERAVWPPYVLAALLLAGTAGFGLGAALFAVSVVGGTPGPWWPAAAQAHGHVQLFGWAGLMVLGVGLHFLHRLRGSTLTHPAWTRSALLLLVVGLVGRAVCQPLLAQASAADGSPVSPLRVALIGAAVLELGGAAVLLWLLAALLRGGPPLRQRKGLRPVLPLFLTSFGVYGLALAVNLLGVCDIAQSSGGLVPDQLDDVTSDLALYGFLLPVAVGMAERTFPLFLRTPLPRHGLLYVGLACLVPALVLRCTGRVLNRAFLTGPGDLLLALALGVFIVALGVFAPRRPLPRQPVRPFRDPVQLHVLTAFLWLAIVAVLLLLEGLATLQVPVPLPAQDAERHAFGAGFITLLILGLGVHLIPGFANRRLRSPVLVWLTLVLVNLAAVLRVGPVLSPWSGIASNDTLLALAGVAGLAALIAFGLNVPLRPRG